MSDQVTQSPISKSGLKRQHQELEERNNELSDAIDLLYEEEEVRLEKDPNFVRDEKAQEKMDVLLKEQWEVSEKMEEIETQMKSLE